MSDNENFSTEELEVLGKIVLAKIKGSPPLLIKDKSLKTIDVNDVGVEKGFKIGDISFNIGAFCDLAISVFNSADDTDTDGILAAEKKNEDDLEPLLHFDPDKTWIKYAFTGGVKSASGTKIEDMVDCSLKADKEITFNSYRLHQPNDKFVDKVIDDIKTYRFVFNRDNIKALAVNEALTMEVSGSFGGSVTVNWADVLTGSLGKLPKILGLTVPIKVDLGLSMKTSLEWSTDDDFIIAFSKCGGQKYRLVMRKAKSTITSGAIAPGVSLKWNPDSQKAMREVMNLMEGSIFGQSLDTLLGYLDDTLLEKLVGETDLNDATKDLLIKAMNLLNIKPLLEPLKKLKTLLLENKKKLDDELEKMIKFEIKFGLEFIYKRIKTDTVLLEAEISETILDKHHASLTRAHLQPFLNDCKNSTRGITLNRFLHEKTLEIFKSSMFRLGIGKWAMGGGTKESSKIVTRENIDGNANMTISNISSYEDFLGQQKVVMFVDFKGEMPRFATTNTPMAAEAEYSLTLGCEWNSFKEKILPAIFDHADLWHATRVGGDSAAEIIEHLKNKSITKAQCLLKFNPRAFSALLPFLLEPVQPAFITALSAALPYVTGRDFKIRNDITKRTAAYIPLWEAAKDYYIDRIRLKISDTTMADQVGQYFRDMDDGSLANFEDVQFFAQRTSSFTGLAYLQNPFYRINHFTQGARCVHAALTRQMNGPFTEVFETAWEGMREMMDVPFLIRTLGVYLITLAGKNPDIMREVESTLSFTYREGAEERRLISTR